MARWRAAARAHHPQRLGQQNAHQNPRTWERAHVFKRDGKAKLPISLLWGPAIPKEMMKEKAVNAFNRSTEGVAKRAMHELQRISFDNG